MSALRAEAGRARRTGLWAPNAPSASRASAGLSEKTITFRRGRGAADDGTVGSADAAEVQQRPPSSRSRFAASQSAYLRAQRQESDQRHPGRRSQSARARGGPRAPGGPHTISRGPARTRPCPPTLPSSSSPPARPRGISGGRGYELSWLSRVTPPAFGRRASAGAPGRTPSPTPPGTTAGGGSAPPRDPPALSSHSSAVAGAAARCASDPRTSGCCCPWQSFAG